MPPAGHPGSLCVSDDGCQDIKISLYGEKKIQANVNIARSCQWHTGQH